MTPTKIPRPKRVPGFAQKVVTGCGNMYVTVTTHDGLPFEVFASLGKSGACTKCQIEGTTRCLSIGLRYGVPVEEFVEQLQGIQCPNPMPFPKEERVLSCSDAIAKVLREEFMVKKESNEEHPTSD